MSEDKQQEDAHRAATTVLPSPSLRERVLNTTASSSFQRMLALTPRENAKRKAGPWGSDSDSSNSEDEAAPDENGGQGAARPLETTSVPVTSSPPAVHELLPHVVSPMEISPRLPPSNSGLARMPALQRLLEASERAAPPQDGGDDAGDGDHAAQAAVVVTAVSDAHRPKKKQRVHDDDDDGDDEVEEQGEEEEEGAQKKKKKRGRKKKTTAKAKPAPRVYKSEIHCGVLLPTGVRQYRLSSQFFGEDVPIYTAVEDTHEPPRVLYKAGLLARHFQCATNKVAMYLSRRRETTDGIFQATKLLSRPEDDSMGLALKVGSYVVTYEVCQAFEKYYTKQTDKKKARLKRKEGKATSTPTRQSATAPFVPEALHIPLDDATDTTG